MRFKQICTYVFQVLFQSDLTLCIIFSSTALFLVLCTAVSILLHSVRVSGALNCLALIGGYLASFFCRLPLWAFNPYFAVLIAFACLSYLFVLVCVHVKDALKKRKIQRQKTERKLQFTLPDKENAFVRARLNTVLSVSDERDDEWQGEEEKEHFTLSHARRLLIKLKEKKLSLADGLEVEEIAQMLKLYLKKETLTIGDIRAVNDTFACLLKLSAKYAV